MSIGWLYAIKDMEKIGTLGHHFGPTRSRRTHPHPHVQSLSVTHSNYITQSLFHRATRPTRFLLFSMRRTRTRSLVSCCAYSMAAGILSGMNAATVPHSVNKCGADRNAMP